MFPKIIDFIGGCKDVSLMETKNDNIILLVLRLLTSLPNNLYPSLFFLIFVLCLAGLAEIFSIGVVVPFLTVILYPEDMGNNAISSMASLFFESKSKEELIFYLSLLFVTAIILATILRTFSIFLQYRLINISGVSISSALLSRILKIDYEQFTEYSSSDLYSRMVLKTRSVTMSVLLPSLLIFNSSIILLFISVIFLIISPLIFLSSVALLTVFYSILSLTLNNIIREKSIIQSKMSREVTSSISDSIRAFRQILVYQIQEKRIKDYQEKERSLRMNEGIVQTLIATPRVILEGMVIISLIILANMLITSSAQPAQFVPIIGAFALGVQRALPLFQAIYASVTLIKSTKNNLKDVTNFEINTIEPQESLPKLVFKHQICFNNVCFKFKNSQENIFQNLNFTVNKGDKVFIIGESGAGKTTLLNLFLGLFEPSSGEITIDGVKLSKKNRFSWNNLISFIPQETVTFDETIENNIAYFSDKKEINVESIEEAINRSNLQNKVNKLASGVKFVIGDNGSKLSGGQNQRLSIARCFYEDREIFICDEPTSALDETNAQKIIENINSNPERTVICVSHKKNLSEYFDKVINLK